MSTKPTNDNAAAPTENGLKQMIERELIRTAPVDETPGDEAPKPALFSQVSHGQESQMRSGVDPIAELPVDENLESKIQEFARRLASVKS